VEKLFAPPADLDAFERRMAELEAPVAISDDGSSHPCAELWLYRMIYTPQPLWERMTLFWHDYFAVAGERVGRARLMMRHVRLLRRHALGRFDTLLREICRDPATLAANGARANRKGRPAVEFASALLRRYTVGAAALAPEDAPEAARAFTGAHVLRDEYQYLEHEHDGGAKLLLGREGNFTGDDALGILLAHPATARTVVRRMYRWLVSETAEPDEALLASLAGTFAKDYDIAALARAILRSNHFFSPAAYRQRVKSPVEFALGLAAAFEAPLAPAALHPQLSELGQRLLEPPTSEGWAGGRRWLNRFTVAGRGTLAAALVGAEGQAGKVYPEEVARRHGRTEPAAIARFFQELLVQSDVPAQARAHQIAMLPEFQLA
jgi:uncharacterized protein (DUF1800 family)